MASKVDVVKTQIAALAEMRARAQQIVDPATCAARLQHWQRFYDRLVGSGRDATYQALAVKVWAERCRELDAA